MSLRRLGLLLATTLVACSGNVTDNPGDDDAPPHDDAAVALPDANPLDPDARPGDPDARPGDPDAHPGAPDADLPDPPDAGVAQGHCGNVTVPFGSHPHPYASGTIKPAHSQAQLDQAVKDFYDTWKGLYLGDGCGGGRYLVLTGMANSKTVSEAHGYGMLLAAYMAGYDSEAKTIFDGMYKYYLAHQSVNTPFLMAWSQDSACNNNQGPDSATDGDLDIAYALLLADKQWGSAVDI
jgi:hypothetical protein